MPDTRIIKRYANRKLYDTEHSRYVTLDQISEMIRNGDDVKIVDNKTKEDLTTVTLAQIIFEEEKKQRSFLPLAAMRNIIQSGGEWFAEAQRRVHRGCIVLVEVGGFRLLELVEVEVQVPHVLVALRQVVTEELLAVKETYGDRRRTQIVTLKEGELASARVRYPPRRRR